MLIDTPQRRHHTHGQLFTRHLHAEYGHAFLFLDGGMFGDIDRKSGFTHGRSASDDHQVRSLKSGCTQIQVIETGGDTGNRTVFVKEFIDLVERLFQVLLDVLVALAAARFLLGYLKYRLFGKLKDLFTAAALGIEDRVIDLVRRVDQLP